MARPSSYTPEIAKEICDRLSQGESLNAICKDDDLPSKVTVFNWLKSEEYSDFLNQYTRAREYQADHYLDEIIEIADDCTDDVELIKLANGESKDSIKHSAIQRARLQIDTRKWTMGKLAPKKYSDKTTISGDPDAPLRIEKIEIVLVD